MTVSGGSIASPIVVKFNRDPAQVSGYEQTLNTPAAIAPSDGINVAFKFYSQPGQAGVVVSEASTTVSLTNGNAAINDVALNRTVKSVVVTAGQSFKVGTPAAIEFQALADDGAIVPVTPGSATFTIAPSTVATLVNGQLSAQTGGSFTIVATVDGVSSPETTALATLSLG